MNICIDNVNYHVYCYEHDNKLINETNHELGTLHRLERGSRQRA